MTSCEDRQDYYISSGPIQGTTYNVTYQWDEDISGEIDSVLHRFNNSLSNFDKNSTISKINRNETDIVDNLFIEMFNVAKEVYENTDGAFDITVAPIVNLWSFGWKDNKSGEITQQKIDSILQYVGMDKVELKDNKIIKSHSNIQFISSAIAKGQSVDYLSAFLNQKGLINFLVEIGGEIYCQGVNSNGTEWRIGIDKPIDNSGYYDRQNQIIISISNKSIATSGNYRQFIEHNGEKKGHSLDPRTGYPAENNLLSVTVIADRCIYADAYATSFMVAGFEKSIEIVEKINSLEAYFIYTDENNDIKEYSTEVFEKFFENE